MRRDIETYTELRLALLPFLLTLFLSARPLMLGTGSFPSSSHLSRISMAAQYPFFWISSNLLNWRVPYCGSVSVTHEDSQDIKTVIPPEPAPACIDSSVQLLLPLECAHFEELASLDLGNCKNASSARERFRRELSSTWDIE